MERFIVEGGRRLEGTIRPGGNKNAALPILAACILTDEPVTLRNLPDIEDVRVMLQILEGLGGSVDRLEANVVRVHIKGECSSTPDPVLSRKIRASILLAGAPSRALRLGCGCETGWRRHRTAACRYAPPCARSARCADRSIGARVSNECACPQGEEHVPR